MEKIPGQRKIVQIAHVVRDIEQTMEQYYKILGIGPWDVYTFAPPMLRESTFRGKPAEVSYLLALTWVGDMQFELMQPLKGHSTYDEFLAKKGEGLHHVKEWVDDCAQAIEQYRQKGIEVIQSGKFLDDEFYYLDTEPQLGILYEIGNNGNIGAPERRYPEP